MCAKMYYNFITINAQNDAQTHKNRAIYGRYQWKQSKDGSVAGHFDVENAPCSSR